MENDIDAFSEIRRVGEAADETRGREQDCCGSGWKARQRISQISELQKSAETNLEDASTALSVVSATDLTTNIELEGRIQQLQAELEKHMEEKEITDQKLRQVGGKERSDNYDL